MPLACGAASGVIRRLPGEGDGSGVSGAIAFLEDEVLGALRESLGNDLSVECVGEDLGPVLERTIGGDGSRAAVVVSLGDDLKGELRLCGVHREHGEVVDDQEFGTDVTPHRTLETTMELGAMELIEHLGGSYQHDALVGLTGTIGQGSAE